LGGEVPERTLLILARQLKDAIESVPEVLKVTIAGNREEVVEVIIDPLRMESYHLNYEEVVLLFRRNNQLVAAGALDTGQGRFNVKIPGVFETVQDIMTLPIKVVNQRVVMLQDIAEIRRTFKDPLNFARVNGKPALALEISKRAGTNLIATIEQIRVITETLRANWPNTIQIEYLQDKSKEIRSMLSDLQNSVLIAVFLVTIIIVASLGVHTAILAAIAIPGSFLLGLLVLAQMGLTMNMVVLFSLILATGMLVDGAVIVTEFADRRMLEGIPRAQAYSMASKRMFWPIIGSTITTIAVFLPLLFWPGIVGEFMKYLPITVIATLTASLLMALIFVPTLGALFGRSYLLHHTNDDTASLHTIRGFTGIYVRMLDHLIRYPLLVLLTACVLLVGVYMAYGKYGNGVEFFPEVEPERINVYVRARGDLAIIERDALVRQVEARLLGMKEFASLYSNSGMVSGQNLPQDTVGVITIEFIDWRWRRPAKEIIKEIRQHTKDLPGILVEVIKQQGGPSEGKPIKLEISATDVNLLNPAVAELVAGLQKIPGVVDIEDSRTLPGIDWKIQVDRSQASRFNADISIIGYGIQLITNGIKVAEYRPDDADEELDIRVRFPYEFRSLDQMDELRIQTQEGLVPLSLFVKRLAVAKIGTLTRSDERRVISIQAGVEEGLLVADLLQKFRTWIATLPKENPHALLIDPRVKLIFKGEDRDQREAQEFLSRAFGIALFLVTLVLVAQFNSFYQTLLILTSIIFSTIGVLLGLLITQQPFGIVMCGIGLIALAGVVVNNNIVLIDTFNILRSEGYDPREAILRTCAQRLRPVFLTTITAILGLLPMVLAINIDVFTREITFNAPSAQWWTQLSTVIAGGLSFATMLTLILTPCLLIVGTRWRKQS